MTDWANPPEVELETEYGPVTAQLMGDGRAYVTTGRKGKQPHINDHNETLVFRGEEYLGSLNVFRDGSTGYVHLTRRSNWSDAPPTYRAKMVAAIVAAVGTLTDQTLWDEAQRADVARELHRLENERATLAAQIAEVDTKIAAQRERLP